MTSAMATFQTIQAGGAQSHLTIFTTWPQQDGKLAEVLPQTMDWGVQLQYRGAMESAMDNALRHGSAYPAQPGIAMGHVLGWGEAIAGFPEQVSELKLVVD